MDKKFSQVTETSQNLKMRNSNDNSERRLAYNATHNADSEFDLRI